VTVFRTLTLLLKYLLMTSKPMLWVPSPKNAFCSCSVYIAYLIATWTVKLTLNACQGWNPDKCFRNLPLYYPSMT
jgi:hypothetical protein